ncbi:MAG: PQQ-binding-like beta-propeller repeat protein [Acidimicrobiia bacterium]|nr:PQQ-binding-like beta-propeller repeat protein [Acidimicrobiia bacterium]
MNRSRVFLISALITAAVSAALWTAELTGLDSAFGLGDNADRSEEGPAVAGTAVVADATTTVPTTTTTVPTTTTTTTTPPYEGWVDPESSGLPWSELGAVEGLLTFRGNPTRTFYGRNAPENPSVVWTHEIGCANSPVGGVSKVWCGSGWTGQPSVFQPPGGDPGTWWLAFGGYDRNVTFLDPLTGEEVYGPYATGDIIKGSITIDPDGYPLMYTGSRDNNYHVVAIDRPEPIALWKLNANAVKPVKWNDDWDGSGLIIDDYLFQGGENSRFFIVKLNRGYDSEGLVTVDPEIVFSTESWDSDLLAVTSNEQSIENSVAISGNTVYFANSSGLIQGWDIGSIAQGGTPERIFRFWAGEDIDASLVIDEQGMIYAGVEYEKGRSRAKELGQVLRLDPSRPEDPVVWSVQANSGIKSGVWATPALHRDIVIIATDDGQILGLDRADGTQRWVIELPGPTWQSPVVVDDMLIQGDCSGVLHGYDVADTTAQPVELWSQVLGEGCLESTPAVWDGGIFVGSRNGTFYALRD